MGWKEWLHGVTEYELPTQHMLNTIFPQEAKCLHVVVYSLVYTAAVLTLQLA